MSYYSSMRQLEPITHLRGKYAIQQQSVRFVLKVIDGLLDFIVRRRCRPIGPPKKILLLLSGHFGDAVMVTALFSPLHALREDIEIGIATGSWNCKVLKDHPKISRLHIYDQWRCNRRSISILAKIWRHIQTAIGALRSIRKQGYDVAVILSPFYGNGVLFMSLSGIHQRIGFDCGGYGALLTHAVKGPKVIDHITNYHMKLLSQIRGFQRPKSPLRPDLPMESQELCPVSNRDFIMINIGAGAQCRKWPVGKWRALVQELIGLGHFVVLTGLGPVEEAEAKEITAGLSADLSDRVLNLTNQLSWDAFAEVMKKASLLIAHDSGAGHLASCFTTPSIILFSGVRSPIISFKPLNERMVPLMEPVACNPCFTVQRGCETMDCIRKISVSSVVRAVNYLMASDPTAFVNRSVSRELGSGL